MPVNLIKPTPEGLKDPAQALKILLRMYEALTELQTSNAVIAAAENDGKTLPVVLRGAAVEDPTTGQPVIADVFALGVRVT